MVEVKLYSGSVPLAPSVARKELKILFEGAVRFTSSGIELHLDRLELPKLRKELSAKKEELHELEGSLHKALDSLAEFRHEHDAFAEDMVRLRSDHVRLRRKFKHVLWEYMPKRFRNDFSSWPKLNKQIAEQQFQVGEWTYGKLLGKGHFAEVRQVTARPAAFDKSGALAIKIIHKSKIWDVKNVRRVASEISIMKELAHRNVIQLVTTVHCEDNIYLIQEKGGTDLFEYSRLNPNCASEHFTKKIISQVVSAVTYLSTKGIIHRDIKPENLLLGKNDVIKLADFGLSTRLNRNLGIEDFCGTPGFFAPEMLLSQSYSGEKLDVWGIACVTLELHIGHREFVRLWTPAYNKKNYQCASDFTDALVRAISKVRSCSKISADDDQTESKVDESNFNGSGLSEEARSFLFSSLVVQPKRRLSVTDMSIHPWLDAHEKSEGCSEFAI